MKFQDFYKVQKVHQNDQQSDEKKEYPKFNYNVDDFQQYQLGSGDTPS